MTKIADTLDLLNIVVKNMAPEVSLAPPQTPVVGQYWTDTSNLGAASNQSAVARFWDGHRWARMDGGGDIPNGMIYDRHVNANAAIAWSKIAYPSNLATTEQVSAVQTSVTNLTTRVSTLESTVSSQGSRLTTAETNISNLQSDNTSNKNRISTNETNIATLQAYNPTEQTRVNNVLAAKADLVGGKIPTSQIPPLALVQPKVYPDLASRDADVTAGNLQEGDLAIVTGVGTYVKDSTANGFILLVAPAGGASNSDLQAEISARQAADAQLQTNINNEASARTSADNALGVRIDNEITNRTSADSTLNSRIDNTNSNYMAADAQLQTNIDNEASARASADTTETNARVAGDATNATAINSEATNRANADTALGTRIDNETTARLAGDAAEASARTSADNTVRSEFAAADNTVRSEFAAADTVLSGQIAAKANDNAVVHNTGAETVAGTKTFSTAPQISSGGFANGGDAKQITPKSYVDAQDTAEANARSSADSLLDGRVTSNTNSLSTLNGPAATAGSVGYIADQRINIARGAANGVAPLDSAMLIPAQYLPSIAVTTVRTVTNNAALAAISNMNAGDMTIVTSWTDPGDTSTGTGLAAFIYDGTAWKQLAHPADITLAELTAAINAAITQEVSDRNAAVATVNTRVTNLVAGTGATRTGDTFNVIGTAGRVVAYADNIDIDPLYIGQTSINTLGTIGTGIWQGTAIDIARGGTGLVGGTTLADLRTYLGLNNMTYKYTQVLTSMTPGTPFTVTHNLNTKKFTWSLRNITTDEYIIGATVIAVNANSLTVYVDATYTATLEITVIG